MDKQAKPELAWTLLKEEHLVQDEWIDFRRLVYQMPDGSIFEPYYSYSRRDYVVIVAADTQGQYLCVRQFRQGIREVTTEFPAGGLEAGEDPLDAAKRELLEETGYVSEEWTHLLTVPSNATLADNYAYVYQAKNCRKVKGQDLDDTEFLNVEKHSKEEIEELIACGLFQQSVHVMAYLLGQRQHG